MVNVGGFNIVSDGDGVRQRLRRRAFRLSSLIEGGDGSA